MIFADLGWPGRSVGAIRAIVWGRSDPWLFTPLSMSELSRAERSRRCAVRFGCPPSAYLRLCRMAHELHLWHEAECNGYIQSMENGRLARFRDDDYGCPSVFVRYVPDHGETVAARAAELAGRYGVSVYVQTDPRGAALHLYRAAELNGRPVNECYSTFAFPCY
jgi:hypothetical protein